jgi:hypothetical protein
LGHFDRAAAPQVSQVCLRALRQQEFHNQHVAVLCCDVERRVFKLLALLVGQLAFADEDPNLIEVPIAARSPDF